MGDVAIVEHASQYYKELFGPSNHTDFHMDPNYWEQGEKINVQENEELSKEFSFNKIKEVVFSMERNTACRPDHFPIEFYQHCWDTIKDDLLLLFNDFHKLKLDIGRFNYSIITLIPKNKGRQ